MPSGQENVGHDFRQSGALALCVAGGGAALDSAARAVAEHIKTAIEQNKNLRSLAPRRPSSRTKGTGSRRFRTRRVRQSSVSRPTGSKRAAACASNAMSCSRPPRSVPLRERMRVASNDPFAAFVPTQPRCTTRTKNRSSSARRAFTSARTRQACAAAVLPTGAVRPSSALDVACEMLRLSNKCAPSSRSRFSAAKPEWPRRRSAESVSACCETREAFTS